ncbi:MAG: hypothetical protein EOS23_28550 [Mesorhizobium sp.]|jgi:hypothetical protein|uniref:Uncharacterized protein n=1 Tax=Mesorhizobium prunaredense TaxID=1631249 RepID=A0A1R3VH87_9HYPH|nr:MULTISPECIES: hypothetical protein [Mesorhizobium]RWB35199.1 MAG: hypothetical protein EOQ41_06475 [Mesorhizobium sp.]RWC34735.1 MAG: hypothetical protein EOS70_11885 [Mesorhizobium sp.]RWC39708.1 MAG: hypothetical protein EOS28_26100 [Mesorhizobium sp.]RWD26779.1 MAG: hypothetical protein EOS34_32635 [Mesorhizobium sp.]RWD44529.1 MAG: hypothetical protein EOS59_23265 [Mesorhizobium sp.]
MSIRRIALTSAAVTLAFTTLAQARPDTRAMTCQQTQALIQSHGSAVLTTGPNTYALYVRRYSNACDWSEIPAVGFVPTRDGQCLVHRCREPLYTPPG